MTESRESSPYGRRIAGILRRAVRLHLILLAGMALLVPCSVFAGNGLITVSSAFSPKDTATLFDLGLKAQALKLLNRLNHAAAAKKTGVELRYTELFTFTDPKNIPVLLQCSQTFGIDLPLKALIWQDEAGQTWITYNDLSFIANRHGCAENCGETIRLMQKTLDKIVKDAATK